MARRVYVDHGLTGTSRDRPGPREALAACREGDTLVVTKLTRSLSDARAIADELTARGPGGEDPAGSGNRLVGLGLRAPGTVRIRTEPATLTPDRPGPATEEREVDERDVVAILRPGHGSAIAAPLPVGCRLDDDDSSSGRSVFEAEEADGQSDQPGHRA